MEFEEKVKKVEHVFDGKIIDLDIETVELPNGKEAKREIIRHQGAVAIIAITDENKMVFIKQWRAPLGQVTLEVPAGKIEPGEDPNVTAVRELNEETRFEADKLEFINTFYTSPGFADEKMYMYHAVNLKPVKDELPQDSDEFLELVELSLPEVDEKPQLRRSSKIDDVQEDSELEGLSRTGSRKLRESNEENYKKNRLKARLNMIIAGLILAIIIVYLIMFFVNF